MDASMLMVIRQTLTAEELQWLERKIEQRGKAWVLRHWSVLTRHFAYLRSL